MNFVCKKYKKKLLDNLKTELYKETQLNKKILYYTFLQDRIKDEKFFCPEDIENNINTICNDQIICKIELLKINNSLNNMENILDNYISIIKN